MRKTTKGWGRWEFTGGVFRESETVRSVGEVVFVRVVRAPDRETAVRLLRRRLGGGAVRMWQTRCLRGPAVAKGA